METATSTAAKNLFTSKANHVKTIANALIAAGFKIEREETENGLIEKTEAAGVFPVIAELGLTRRIKKPNVSYGHFGVQVNDAGVIIAGLEQGQKFADVYGDQPKDLQPEKSSRLYNFILDLRIQQTFNFD